MAKKKSISVPSYPDDAAVREFKTWDFRVKSVRFHVFTPALLAHILKINLRNRGVVKKAYNCYVSDQSGDRWEDDTTDSFGFAYIRGDERVDDGTPDVTEGVVLDARGRLTIDSTTGEYVTATKGPRTVMINGQHRAASGAATGTTFSAGLMLGLKLSVRGVIDNNEARTARHQLELNGIPDSARTTAIIYAYDALIERESRRVSGPAVQQMMQETGPHLKWALDSITPDGTYGTPQIAAAFMYAHMAVSDDVDLLKKLDQIAYYQRIGVGFDETHPIFYFRRYCHVRKTDSRSRMKKRTPAYFQALRTLNAIMHALTDTTMKEPPKNSFPSTETGFKYFSGRLEPATTDAIDGTADTSVAEGG